MKNDNTFSFLDYSVNGNLLDEYLHEFTLSFVILGITGLFGLFIGWLLWRKSKQRYLRAERENARIRAKREAA